MRLMKKILTVLALVTAIVIYAGYRDPFNDPGEDQAVVVGWFDRMFDPCEVYVSQNGGLGSYPEVIYTNGWTDGYSISMSFHVSKQSIGAEKIRPAKLKVVQGSDPDGVTLPITGIASFDESEFLLIESLEELSDLVEQRGIGEVPLEVLIKMKNK